MKNTAFIWILFCLLFIAAGCKTHRIAKGRENYSYGWDAGLTGARLSGYQFTDSLIRQWQRQLTGRILLWSPPDSEGKQYIQAEIDLQTQEASETGQLIYGTATDTTHVSAIVKNAEVSETDWHQETLHDSRIVSRTAIMIFCILGLMAWFYYQKK